MAKVIVHIGRLVLRGIVPAQREMLLDGLREELGRAFAPSEVAARWAASGHRESVSDRSPCMGQGRSLGIQAARRIAKGGLT